MDIQAHSMGAKGQLGAPQKRRHSAAALPQKTLHPTPKTTENNPCISKTKTSIDRPIQPLNMENYAHSPLSMADHLTFFLNSQETSLCLLPSEPFTARDYQNIWRSIHSKKVVYIHTESDILTQREAMNSADLLLIDYTQIYQADILNKYLEEAENHAQKIIGILDKSEFEQQANSFQSRWEGQLAWVPQADDSVNDSVISSRPTPELNPSSVLTPSSTTLELTRGLNLATCLKRCEASQTVHLLGPTLETPIAKCFEGYLNAQGKTVQGHTFPFPHTLHTLYTTDALKGKKLINATNFTDVKGEFALQSGVLQRNNPASEICVTSALSDSQWRYLGYLQLEKDLKISVIPTVHPPVNIDESAAINTTPSSDSDATEYIHSDSQLLSQIRAHPHPLWIASSLFQAGERVENALKNNAQETYRIIVQPDDRLSNFIGKLVEKKEGATYLPGSLHALLEDPDTFIIFDNIDGNPELKMELETLCLTQEYRGQGQVIPIKARLVFTAFSPPSTPFIHKVSFYPQDTQLSCPQKESLDTFLAKTEGLNAVLTTGSGPFVLTGPEGSGKSQLLTSALNAANIKETRIVASQITDPDTIKDQIRFWAQLDDPPALVIDHYNAVPDGFWRFLISDTNNQILIDGKSYPLTDKHRCFFIDRVGNTAHRIENWLPVFHFSPYSDADIPLLIDTLSVAPLTQDWLNQVNHALAPRLHRCLTLTELAEIAQWFENSLSQGLKIDDAKVIALHTFLLCQTHNKHLLHREQTLPVDQTVWTDYCQQRNASNKTSAFLTEDQAMLYPLIIQFIRTPHAQNKPILWIEGEAGCGKDYIVNKALAKADKEPIRAKGSSLQDVLKQAERAKREGGILVVEEADLLCMNVLESLIDATHAQPGYCVLATVNGVSYKGRERLSPSLAARTLHYQCSPISPTDLAAIFASKYPSSTPSHQGRILTQTDIETLCRLYASTTVAISPREIMSVVKHYLSTSLPLKVCWDRKISPLNAFRPPRPQPSSVTTGDPSPIIFLKSGMGKNSTSMEGESSVKLLPISMYNEDKYGVQHRCHSQKNGKTMGKDGFFNLIVETTNRALFNITDGKWVIMLPIPTGTNPFDVHLGSERHPHAHPCMEFVNQDNFGGYYLEVPPELQQETLYLSVDYVSDETLDSETVRDTGRNLYQEFRITLPPSLDEKMLTNPQIDIDQKIREILMLFHKMHHDISQEAQQLYAGATSGEALVNRCLSLQRGCCHEFSHTFAAIVGHYLNCPVRYVCGLLAVSNSEMGFHAWVEIYVHDAWHTVDIPSMSENSSSTSPQLSEENSFTPFLDPSSEKTSGSAADFSLGLTLINDGSPTTDLPPQGRRGLPKFKISRKKKTHAGFLNDQPQNLFSLARLRNCIMAWCYGTHHLKSITKPSFLPSSEKKGELNLEMYHDLGQAVYEEFELQPGYRVPAAKILVTKFTQVSDVQELLNMDLDVFISTEAGIKQIHKIEEAGKDWKDKELSKAERVSNGLVNINDLLIKKPVHMNDILEESEVEESMMFSAEKLCQRGYVQKVIEILDNCKALNKEFYLKKATLEFCQKKIDANQAHQACNAFKKILDTQSVRKARVVNLSVHLDIPETVKHLVFFWNSPISLTDLAHTFQSLPASIESIVFDFTLSPIHSNVFLPFIHQFSGTLKSIEFRGLITEPELLDQFLRLLPSSVELLTLEIEVGLDEKKGLHLATLLEKVILSKKNKPFKDINTIFYSLKYNKCCNFIYP